MLLVTIIQIQHLLKLNSRYGKRLLAHSIIQIQHLLKLNMELKETDELMIRLKYNTC